MYSKASPRINCVTPTSNIHIRTSACTIRRGKKDGAFVKEWKRAKRETVHLQSHEDRPKQRPQMANIFLTHQSPSVHLRVMVNGQWESSIASKWYEITQSAMFWCGLTHKHNHSTSYLIDFTNGNCFHWGVSKSCEVGDWSGLSWMKDPCCLWMLGIWEVKILSVSKQPSRITPPSPPPTIKTCSGLGWANMGKWVIISDAILRWRTRFFNVRADQTSLQQWNNATRWNVYLDMHIHLSLSLG